MSIPDEVVSAAFDLDLLDRLLGLRLLRQRHVENAVLECGLDLVGIDRARPLTITVRLAKKASSVRFDDHP